MTTNETQVVNALLFAYEPWRKQIGVIDSSCLWAARSGIEVLEYFGVPAEPHVVSVGVQNAAMHEYFNTHEITGNEDWDAIYQETGAWSTGTAPDTSPDDPRLRPLPPGVTRWNGHVVLTTPSLLVDLSVAQYSRRDRNIDLQPLAIPLDEEGRARFMDNDTWIMASGKNGTVVHYRRETKRVPKEAPDWQAIKSAKGRTDVAALINVVNKIVEAVRSQPQN